MKTLSWFKGAHQRRKKSGEQGREREFKGEGDR